MERYSKCSQCRHHTSPCNTCVDANNFAEYDRVDSNDLFALVGDLISAGFRGSAHSVVIHRITEYLCTAKAGEAPKTVAQQPQPNSTAVIDDGGSVDMSRYPDPDKPLEIL